MKFVISKVWIVCLLMCVAFTTNAQKESELLKKKQKRLEKKISFTKSLLSSTRNKSSNTITDLKVINRQIHYRQELINTFNYQINHLNRRIDDGNSIIESLERDIVVLKKQYEQMLVYAFKNRNNTHKLMYVFSAENLNEGYRRMNYIQSFAEYRKKQFDYIQQTIEELAERNQKLAEIKDQKLQLVGSKKEEKEKYSTDQKERSVVLTKFKKEESRLRKVLIDQERKKQQLARQIRKAIEKELALVAKRSTSSGKFKMTPETKLASKNFESNKGKLPWPVERGTITSHFGKNAHPVLKDIFTNNNGVDISTPKGATVRTVFKGKITNIFVIPGAGKAVMISHGAYRTVYANLKEVFVQKGDEINTKESIGVLLPSSGSKISEAHFEIWKISANGMEKQNPTRWISK